MDIPKNKVARMVTDFKVDGVTALPAKIMDITAAVDDAIKTCDISAHVPPNTKAILIYCSIQSGSGTFSVYANSGATTGAAKSIITLLPIINQEFKHKKGTSGDDFDIHLLAYYIEGPAGK